MCGIFGFITVGNDTLSDEQLTTVGRALAHRGPDDQGVAILRGVRSTTHLVHRRLAVVDLSPLGHQPMFSKDGRYALVFNGEIFNHRVLRAELEAIGLCFTSSSDTEVVLHALVTWGVEAVERFVGMFAIAFWDNVEEKLLLVRDRLGLKPLYWGQRNRRHLFFASEVQALVAAGVVEPRLDETGLSRWLETGAAHDPRTLLSGVHALLPGHRVEWIPERQPLVSRYWHALHRPSPKPPHDWRFQLRERLKEAVKIRLEADVPVAVFLSGGVDSAAVTALAAEGAPDKVKAFTVAFDDPRFDERERATAIARHLGVAHQIVAVRPEDITEHVDHAFDAQDQPSYDGINTWLVSRAARQAGFVVALAGTGGDELFAGYTHFHMIRALSRLHGLSCLVPEAGRRALDSTWANALSVRIRKGIRMIGAANDVGTLVGIVREVFSPAQRRALLVGRAPPLVNESNEDIGVFSAPGAAHHFSAITRHELSHYMRDTQLRDIDTMSMAHGVEIRAPFLDHRVVEQVLAIPDHAKLRRQGLNKALLVELAGLPPALMRAPKMGFVLPWDPWLRGPLRGWAEAQLFDGTAGQILAQLEVRRLWRAFLERRQGVNYSRMLALIALRKWVRRTGVEC